MKAHFFIFLFFAFLFNVQDSYASSDESILEQMNTFHRIEKDYEIQYKKIEPSGCTTVLNLNKRHPFFNIAHGFQCNVDPEKRESINDIATSIREIIKHFGLVNDITHRNFVYINVGWRINNEPIIHFINYDESWPTNIHTFIKERYTNNQDRYVALRERLRAEIEESKIYGPIIRTMSELGCKMTLEENFVEGLFFDEHKITKNMLIEWGVFKEEETKKDEYPVLKGPIRYKLKCGE